MDRLISMANAHVQTGRYYSAVNTGCGTGGSYSAVVKFPRPFSEAPEVLTSIVEYDLCHFGGYNRAYSRYKDVSGTQFTAEMGTWGDTRLYGAGVEVRPCLFCLLVVAPHA